MKSTTQFSKSMPSSSSLSSKNKKSEKDREKRKSQSSVSENNHVINEKGSPNNKDSSGQYAGLDAVSINIYAEHCGNEVLPKDICDLLSEDINHKLRYIIEDALLKARMCGRNKINFKDVEETFENLRIEKVYGASVNPNWLPLADQNVLYLDDTEVNLIEIANEDMEYLQPGTVTLIKKWYPEEINKPLRQYFVTLCQSVVSSDKKLRQIALKDISTNGHIGPVIEWFYHFGYFLLSKDITYDCLTLRALDLIGTLENSPLGSSNVSEKQLKLLARLILQRLLKSTVSKEVVLKPMCWLLGLLCLRIPIRGFVIKKINQKINGISHDFSLSILTIVHYLGVEAISDIFLPNLNYFLIDIMHQREPELIYTALAIYNVICRVDLCPSNVHLSFWEAFDNVLVMFWRPLPFKPEVINKDEVNFVQMKIQLIRSRRKIKTSKSDPVRCLEEVFELPAQDCKISKLLEDQKLLQTFYNKKTYVVLGKTTANDLMLSVLKTRRKKMVRSKCVDHSLLAYNL